MLKKEVNMLSGPIMPGLVAITMPIMVMNVLQSLFNIIDMAMLKMLIPDSDIAVGAVGVCGTLITLVSCLVVGVATGANVVIAKGIGQKDREHVEKAVGTAMVFSVLGGLVLTAVGVLCADVFLGWVNCPALLFPSATLYFRLYFAGVPLLMLYNFAAASLRATGDTKRPMIYSLIGGALKILFTYLFVSTFGMTVDGVAYATILSWVTMALPAVIALARNKGMVRIRLARLGLYLRELKGMISIGIPTGVQSALYTAANVIIVAAVNSFGPAASTGISIANNFDGILYQISIAPSLAVLPYVSQNIGAGNVKRATQAVWRGMLITVSLGATFGMLSAVFSAELSSIMSADPTVIAFSQQKMIIISSTYFICGINEILGAALRGMGKPIIPTVCALIYMCGMRFLWVYFVFPLYRNLTFLYLVWPISWILMVVTLLCFLLPRLKQLRVRFAEREAVRLA